MTRTFESGPERSALGFLESAERHFAFLLERGCQVVERQVTLLRYDCDSTYVVVFHARGGYNLGVEIGLLAEPKVRADLYSIMAIRGDQPSGSSVAQTQDEVERGLTELARLLRVHGEAALDGDSAVFAAVNARDRAYTVQFTEAVAGPRWRAKQAWDRGDRRAAAAYYAQIEDFLTPEERARLASVALEDAAPD